MPYTVTSLSSSSVEIGDVVIQAYATAVVPDSGLTDLEKCRLLGLVSYVPTSDYTTLSGAYTLTAADAGKKFYCSAALTITIPAGLLPKPDGVHVMCSPTGNVSIASSGGTVLNGATSTLTRTRASNFGGFTIRAYGTETDTYGVSGA